MAPYRTAMARHSTAQHGTAQHETARANKKKYTLPWQSMKCELSAMAMAPSLGRTCQSMHSCGGTYGQVIW